MNQKLSLHWRNTVLSLRNAIRSSVVQNVASLYVVQFANYILPLITVPYLIRILGPAGYGTVAFGQSLIAYFILLVEYGFSFSVTRRIARERNDPLAISRIVFSVWASQILLCFAGFGILVLLVVLIPKLNEVTILLLVLYSTVVGRMLLPLWLFQGMEKMFFASLINLIMQVFIAAGIFTMVHQSSDYLIYAEITGVASVTAGLAGAGLGLYVFKLQPVFPSWREIWSVLTEGWPLFLSMASISFYTLGNVLILGLMTNHTIVGYYSAGERIVQALSGLLLPLSQAAFPKSSRLASISKPLALQWVRKLLLLMGGLGLAITVTLLVGASLIVNIILGPEYETSIKVIRILSFFVFINSISLVWGHQIMLPFGHDRAFAAIPFGAGIMNIILALLLIPLWKESGMAAAVVLSSSFVPITMIIYLHIHKLFPYRTIRETVIA